jgi:membrane protein implicated in regulation of membrane protease activity
MLTPMPFFYLTLAAAAFLVASRVAGGRHHGRHGHRGGRAGRGRAVRFWSFNTVFSFLAGFGVGGFFAAAAGWSTAATLATASAAGAALAALEAALLAALIRREGSSSHRVEDFVGCLGTVEVSIAANGVGRVRCRRGRASEALLARSASEAVSAGSLVRVTSVAGSTVVVEPVDPDEVTGQLTWRGSQQ